MKQGHWPFYIWLVLEKKACPRKKYNQGNIIVFLSRWAYGFWWWLFCYQLIFNLFFWNFVGSLCMISALIQIINSISWCLLFLVRFYWNILPLNLCTCVCLLFPFDWLTLCIEIGKTLQNKKFYKQTFVKPYFSSVFSQFDLGWFLQIGSP